MTRERSSNANTACRVFKNLSRKTLETPKIIDDYNHYMGGVDIADQLIYERVLQLSVNSLQNMVSLVFLVIRYYTC